MTFYQVGVILNDGAVSVSVTPRESLCDGKFHVVTGMTFHADNITYITYITYVRYMSSSKFEMIMLLSSSVQTT